MRHKERRSVLISASSSGTDIEKHLPPSPLDPTSVRSIDTILTCSDASHLFGTRTTLTESEFYVQGNKSGDTLRDHLLGIDLVS